MWRIFEFDPTPLKEAMYLSTIRRRGPVMGRLYWLWMKIKFRFFTKKVYEVIHYDSENVDN